MSYVEAMLKKGNTDDIGVGGTWPIPSKLGSSLKQVKIRLRLIKLIEVESFTEG